MTNQPVTLIAMSWNTMIGNEPVYRCTCGAWRYVGRNCLPCITFRYKEGRAPLNRYETVIMSSEVTHA